MRSLRTGVVVLLLLVVPQLFALPKFAVQSGLRCQSCHVNPAGKGMRNSFGATFGREDLPIAPPTSDEIAALPSLRVAPGFSLGFDLRTLFTANRPAGASSLFLMQADLYISVDISKDLTLYVDKGAYSGFEIFALVKVLPLNGAVKVGKFSPWYGLRTEDHTSFVRSGPASPMYGSLFPSGYPSGLIFGERSEDAGVEISFSPSFAQFAVGVFNGTPGTGIAFGSSKSKALLLRAESSVALGDAYLLYGASGYAYPDGANSFSSAALFGGIGFGEDFSILLEGDIVRTVGQAGEQFGRMLYIEADASVVNGVRLIGMYDFYDPDRALQNGAFSRYTLGIQLFPMMGIEVTPMYRINREEPKEFLNDEFLLQFHMYL